LENHINEETQMAAIKLTGASSTTLKDIWPTLNWPKLNKHILRLQMRIAKAGKESEAECELCNVF
jgi:hypothetical protein